MVEGLVYTALRGLVADRCYPTVFPQDEEGNIVAKWPAIRYTVASVVPVVDVCGTGPGDTDDTRLTIDAVADTHGAALALRAQVRAAMQADDLPFVRDIGFVAFDSEIRKWRATDDYLHQPSSEVATS